jgi:ABC-type anion transport system duplicated permease subunit
MLSNIFKSVGAKRTIASILAVAVPVMQAVPVLAPYAETVTLLAGLFGLIGVGHAAAEGTLTDASKGNC